MWSSKTGPQRSSSADPSLLRLHLRVEIPESLDWKRRKDSLGNNIRFAFSWSSGGSAPWTVFHYVQLTGRITYPMYCLPVNCSVAISFLPPGFLSVRHVTVINWILSLCSFGCEEAIYSRYCADRASYERAIWSWWFQWNHWSDRSHPNPSKRPNRGKSRSAEKAVRRCGRPY